MRDYKKCDEFKESLVEGKCRGLQCELKRIQISNYQSSWYYNKKGNTTGHRSDSPSSLHQEAVLQKGPEAALLFLHRVPVNLFPLGLRCFDLPSALLQLWRQWGVQFL